MTTANGQTPADPMLIMLMIAAAITLGVNITRSMAGGHADILECVGIFFAIALSVTITVVMEGRSAKAFEALNDINDDTTITVVRDGEFGKNRPRTARRRHRYDTAAGEARKAGRTSWAAPPNSSRPFCSRCSWCSSRSTPSTAASRATPACSPICYAIR